VLILRYYGTTSLGEVRPEGWKPASVNDISGTGCKMYYLRQSFLHSGRRSSSVSYVWEQRGDSCPLTTMHCT
jgi:hypothetical protein